MEIHKLSYQANPYDTSLKEFNNYKEDLKKGDFTSKQAMEVINKFVTKEHYKSLDKIVNDNTIFVCVPYNESKEFKNILPKLYAQTLSEKYNKPSLDLNDFILYNQKESSRSTYNIERRSMNDFSYNFKSQGKYEDFKMRTKYKDLVLVADVITTGETVAHLATYLREKADINIAHVHALVTANNRNPSDRDMNRLAQKIQGYTNDNYSMKEIMNKVHYNFSPYTHLKLARYERSVNDPSSAMRAFNTMSIDSARVESSIQLSINKQIPRSIQRDHDLEL
jgi:hypothetical protein